MNDYIPPCDTYREEDFEFVGTIEEIDPDTGDILYGVRENKRCESCFLREACIAEVMKLLQKE